MMLFVSCGKEEEQQQESGADEYVNVTSQVSLDDMMASALTWQEAGGKLYCSVRDCIYDIPMAQALELQTAQEVNVTDVGASIRKFCVDGDGNIYWEPMFQSEERYLHKYLAGSGEDMQIPLALGYEMINALVTDQNGGSKATENLVADFQGNLFYLQNVVQDTRVRVLYQGTQKWVELTGLPQTFLGVGSRCGGI